MLHVEELVEGEWVVVRTFKTKARHITAVHADWRVHPKLKNSPNLVKHYEQSFKVAMMDRADTLINRKGNTSQKLFCRVAERTFAGMDLPHIVANPDEACGEGDEPILKIFKEAKGLVLTEEGDDADRLHEKQIIGMKATAFPKFIAEMKKWKEAFDAVEILNGGMTKPRKEKGDLVHPGRVKQAPVRLQATVPKPDPKPKRTTRAKKPPSPKTPFTPRRAAARPRATPSNRQSPPSTPDPDPRILVLQTCLDHERARVSELTKLVDSHSLLATSYQRDMTTQANEAAAKTENLREANARRSTSLWERGHQIGYEKGIAEGKLVVMTQLIEKNCGMRIPHTQPSTSRSGDRDYSSSPAQGGQGVLDECGLSQF